ncbi:armadillo-type protein [Gongronella butleri]|nr:armadillo-type protein [Gongronella butleri]
MTLDEFDPDNFLVELNRKMANVTINPSPSDIITKASLMQWRRYLYQDDPEVCFAGVQQLRRYLTQATGSSTEHVDDLLALDILPRLRHWLSCNEHANLQFEIAWIITNIAAGDSRQTDVLVANDFIPVLTEVLKSNMTTLTVKTQSAWALSNFAGESPHLRELLLEHDSLVMVALVLQHTAQEIMEQLSESTKSVHDRVLISHHATLNDVKALTWSLSNMSRGGFLTANYWDKYVPAFNALTHCVSFDHKDIWVDSCWGLSRVMYNMHEVYSFYESVSISRELCARLSSLLEQEDLATVVPVLRCIINITSGPNEHSQSLLETDILSKLAPLTNPETPLPIRRDAFLVVSNLMASNSELVKVVSDARFIMDCVVAHIRVPGHHYNEELKEWHATVSNAYYNQNDEWKITHEALWVLCNLTNLGTDETIQTLLARHPDLNKALVHLLAHSPVPLNVCTKALDVTLNIVGRTNKIAVSVGLGCNPHLQTLEQLGLEDLLVDIRGDSSSMEVRKRIDVLRDSLMTAKITSATVSASNAATSSSTTSIAALFGLGATIAANKRRVLRGQEDGDIRFIANAVNNLSITEQ